MSKIATTRDILVTGAGGSIGSELCRQLYRFAPASLVMVERDESALHAVQLSIEGRAMLDSRNLVVADIRDRARMRQVFAEHRPEATPLALDRIEQAIKRGEAMHSGQVRFVVEGALDGLPLLTPEVTARAIEAAQRECPEIEQPDVVAALTGFDALWESLFPAEQARIARLLVERVTVGSDGMAVDLRTEGLGSVVREMVTPRREMAA